MSEPAWWQQGAIYQIYPRSFADADGDGVGDLAGITARLDHLARAAGRRRSGSRRSSRPRWPTSATTSPTTATSTRSSARSPTSTSWSTQCHARDIKVVLDWVPNHSSDQHPWFQESRSSRENPKRDWYTWRDDAPNDWVVGVQGLRPRVDATTRPRASTTCTASCPSSPTSTGRTRRSSRRCTTRCASGWTAASTGCAWTRSPRSPRTRCCATRSARPSATTRTGSRSTASCAASARSSTNTTTG